MDFLNPSLLFNIINVMKQIISLVLVITIIAIACKKNKDVIPTSGTTSATINGKNWTANFVGGAKKDDSTISFIAKIQKLNEFKEPYPYDNLGFIIKKDIEKQNVGADILVVPYVHFYTSIEQGHATNERFAVLELTSEDNWVQITEEKNDFKEIKGKFSLTLIKTSTGIDPNRYPDTLRIRDGVFSVTLD